MCRRSDRQRRRGSPMTTVRCHPSLPLPRSCSTPTEPAWSHRVQPGGWGSGSDEAPSSAAQRSPVTPSCLTWSNSPCRDRADDGVGGLVGCAEVHPELDHPERGQGIVTEEGRERLVDRRRSRHRMRGVGVTRRCGQLLSAPVPGCDSHPGLERIQRGGAVLAVPLRGCRGVHRPPDDGGGVHRTRRDLLAVLVTQRDPAHRRGVRRRYDACRYSGRCAEDEDRQH
jgi:hypothetical protein